MAENRRKSLSLTMGDKQFSATYTQRTTTQINEEGLRKALGATVYDQFTVKKLDRKALEKAMTDGDIDPITVARFAEPVPGKTFVTFREKEVSDEPA